MHGRAGYAEASRNLRLLHALTGERFDLAPLLRREHGPLSLGYSRAYGLLSQCDGFSAAFAPIVRRVCTACRSGLRRMGRRLGEFGTGLAQMCRGSTRRSSDVTPPAPDWTVHHPRTPGPAELPRRPPVLLLFPASTRSSAPRSP